MDMAGKTKIDDFGEKIGGARKDQWSGGGVRLPDLANFSPEEYVPAAAKDKVWPAPDYEALIEGGMSHNGALSIKLLRDSLPASPPRSRYASTKTRTQPPSEDACREYVQLVGQLADLLRDCTTDEDLRSVMDLAIEATDKVGGYEHIDYYDVSDFSHLCRSIRDGRIAHTSPWFRHRRNNPLWPKKEATWQRMARKRGLHVGEHPKDSGEYCILNWMDRPFSGDYTARYATEEEAAERLRQMMSERTARAKRKEIPASLEGVERIGPEHRQGRDATDTDFLEVFGFRGCEFGNWLNQEERRLSMNYAYDSLLDLAEACALDPRDISLGGTLALAFGARGRGGNAAAHYEPGRDVINLTKPSGAGSLAHEWFHAFDHYINKVVMGYGRSTNWSACDRLASIGSYDLQRATEDRPDAIANLILALHKTTMTLFTRKDPQHIAEKKFMDATKSSIEKCCDNIRGWVHNLVTQVDPALDEAQRTTLKKQLSDSFTSLAMAGVSSMVSYEDHREWIESLRLAIATVKKLPGRNKEGRSRCVEGIRSNVEYCNREVAALKKVESMSRAERTDHFDFTTPSGKTEFHRQSKRLDKSKGKPYFTLPHEMGARAFEIWCGVRLKAAGRRSDYLVAHDKLNEPEAGSKQAATCRYPIGEDRIAICKRMDSAMARAAIAFGHAPNVAVHDNARFVSYSIGNEQKQTEEEEEGVLMAAARP